MTSGSQLLLIFQFPGLSNPLANLVSCVRGGLAFCRRMDMVVATGLKFPFPDGWALPTSTWPVCTDLWKCSSPASFISSSLDSFYDLAVVWLSGKAILTLW